MVKLHVTEPETHAALPPAVVKSRYRTWRQLVLPHTLVMCPYLVTIRCRIRFWKISFVDEYIYLLPAGHVKSNVTVIGESRTGK